MARLEAGSRFGADGDIVMTEDPNPIRYIVERTKQVQGRVNAEESKNQNLQEKLRCKRIVNHEREQSNLLLKREVLEAEADLAKQQTLLNNYRSEEEDVGKELSSTVRAVKQMMRDLIQGALYNEQRSQILHTGKERINSHFGNVEELKTLEVLKQQAQENAAYDLDLDGLQEAEQEGGLENSILRKQLQQRTSKLHELKMRLGEVQADIEYNVSSHKRTLTQLESEAKATKERHSQAVKDLKELEERVVKRFKDIAANEKEQRRLKQALRFA